MNLNDIINETIKEIEKLTRLKKINENSIDTILETKLRKIQDNLTEHLD